MITDISNKTVQIAAYWEGKWIWKLTRQEYSSQCCLVLILIISQLQFLMFISFYRSYAVHVTIVCELSTTLQCQSTENLQVFTYWKFATHSNTALRNFLRNSKWVYIWCNTPIIVDSYVFIWILWAIILYMFRQLV